MTSFDAGYDSGAWNDDERAMWDDLSQGHSGLHGDENAQFMFHEAYFDDQFWQGDNVDIRQQLEDALVEYLEDNYDMDFYEEMDWDAYDEWYEDQ